MRAPVKSHVTLAIAVCCAWGLTLGCGGGGSSSQNASQAPIPTSGQNVQPIVVNTGPVGNYANGAFTSVTVCVPGSSTCQTISGVLVDIGSVGLRILSSSLTLTLPQQKAPSGDPVAECLPFLDSYTWGPVESADVEMSGEKASAVPIQVLSDTDFSVPSGCTDFGLQSADTLQALGANGLLGVGMYAQDCGGGCAQSGSYGLYYECPSSGCQPITEPLSAQVQNPVALFATDNNGVVIELPAVNGSEATLSGSLIFGIGTESNNGLGSATVYTLNSDAGITTEFNGQSYPNSFLDSGSNGLYFLDSAATSIPDCGDLTYFYCPANVENLSATNTGGNAASAAISFSVANADNLFNSDPNDAVFSQLAGPNPDSFDWGLPFFYGRDVFTAIQNAATPGGTGPYWAY
ncbi:MAG TPA: DUF3443 domain-containing protein [Terriglobales bacterium]|nr:DUF3443 domain-containing protein [Terriglobales bacterium]